MNSKKKEVREDIGLHIAQSSLDVTYALMQQLVPGTYSIQLLVVRVLDKITVGRIIRKTNRLSVK